MMSSADSSSEDENTEKFKEAVWNVGPRTNETHETEKDGVRNIKVSKRMDVSEHRHDGNELQTTPEFRCHVSRKLAAMLDSSITEVTCETPDANPDANPQHCKNGQEEGDDAGFRLFSTSLPGRWWKESTPPLPPKRHTAPSSSDSDSEMELRLREAAVCIADLLPFSTNHPQETRKMEADTQDRSVQKKRKRKSAAASEESEGKESLSRADRSSTPQQTTREAQSPEHHTSKRKRKKNSKIKRLDEGGQN